MKKNILGVTCLVLFMLTVPCFAKQKKTDDNATEAASATATKSEKDDKSEKKQKKSSKKETETAENQKKNYTGWIDTSGKDIDLKLGSIHLKARPKLGTFNILVINEDGKSIPVLSTANEYTSSAFYLKYNKKVYKLCSENNIQASAKKRKDGIDLIYNIQNVAEVTINFDCLESEAGNGCDMVKVTSTVVNKGQKKATIAVKMVLDTILGETDMNHFYTYDYVPIKNEVLYRTMQNQKYFISKNSAASMQLLLTGADITPVELVALANYSTLSKNTWEPEMLSYRAFDTVLSYNNSAVGVCWPQKTVSVNGKTSTVFYIALSSGYESPNGYAYIQQKEAVKAKEIPVINVPENTVVTEGKIEKKSEADSAVKEYAKTDDAKSVEAAKVVKVETSKEIPEPVKIEAEQKPVPNVKFDVSTLTKDQLTPEYIQNLLDRILALEESDSILNREELLQLNAELDAILESLR